MLLLTVPVNAQRPTFGQNDTRSYVGLYWGSAGIVETLISILEFDDENLVLKEMERNEVISAVWRAIDGIWESRIILDNGTKIAAWSKYTQSDIYPGQKYGAAGIIKVLVKAYQYFNDESYLSYASEAADELILERSGLYANANWGYSYSDRDRSSGLSLTDLTFGSLGIIEALLTIFEVTDDNKYLEFSIDAATWIQKITVEQIVDDKVFNVIPFYDALNGLEIYTGLAEGNSGAFKVLSQLAEHAENDAWRTWAMEIANWTKAIQRTDGSWSFNPLRSEFKGRTSRYFGVAGILEGLLDIQDESFEDVIRAGYAWLLNQKIQNETHIIFPQIEGQQNGRFDLDFGMAGILKSFRIANNMDYVSVILDGWSWMLDNALYEYTSGSDQLLGLIFTASDGTFTDLSRSEGLSGVISELLNVYENENFNHSTSAPHNKKHGFL
ncbi:MAG: hypothetical protein IH840_13595 [Candidatus Heimdallarchaeota archaeon]|nr:hypothetical protein [Candidatus Heimdallarchaeota archaeon]